jgi:hypothetical protein
MLFSNLPQKYRGVSGVGQMSVGKDANTNHTNPPSMRIVFCTYLAPRPDRVNRHEGLTDRKLRVCLLTRTGCSELRSLLPRPMSNNVSP